MHKIRGHGDGRFYYTSMPISLYSRNERYGDVIPTVTEQPIKCLGMRRNMQRQRNYNFYSEHLQTWLGIIERCDLPGKYKAWFALKGASKNIVAADDIRNTTYHNQRHGAQDQRQVAKIAELPSPFIKIGLYRRDIKLKLHLSSLTEEFKVSKSRTAMPISESRDECVSILRITLRSGRKWNAGTTIECAKS